MTEKAKTQISELENLFASLDDEIKQGDVDPLTIAQASQFDPIAQMLANKCNYSDQADYIVEDSLLHSVYPFVSQGRLKVEKQL